MERSLTKIRDVDLKILSELDDRDLLNYCKTHKYGNELCNNEDFWRNRVDIKFPGAGKIKSPDRIWKNFYLKIVYYSKYHPTQGMLKAAKRNEIDMVKFFIIKGESRSGWDQYDWDAGLYRASQGGYIDLMKFFIEKGAGDLNSAIRAAAFGGHKNAIDYLISQSEVWTWTDEFWEEGLTGARRAGNKELINFFYDKIFMKPD